MTAWTGTYNLFSQVNDVIQKKPVVHAEKDPDVFVGE